MSLDLALWSCTHELLIMNWASNTMEVHLWQYIGYWWDETTMTVYRLRTISFEPAILTLSIMKYVEIYRCIYMHLEHSHLLLKETIDLHQMVICPYLARLWFTPHISMAYRGVRHNLHCLHEIKEVGQNSKKLHTSETYKLYPTRSHLDINFMTPLFSRNLYESHTCWDIIYIPTGRVPYYNIDFPSCYNAPDSPVALSYSRYHRYGPGETSI